jgi:general secretion pathway protein F/type IV pilus assembly protein PilC
MPLYRYVALSEKGKKTTSTIDADTMGEAKLKLVRRQIVAIHIEPLSEKEMKISLSKKETLGLTRELARLLQAGLPLFEALSALEEKYRGNKAHKLLIDLCERVKSGEPFSKALLSHPKTFDLLYTSMIANSEKTGRLGPALDELSQLLGRQQQIRKQIVSALLYPALLSLFCLVVLSSLLFFVIPSLKELFEGRNLHPFTRVVFAASEFACNSKPLLAILFMGLIGLCVGCVYSSRWKKNLMNWAFKIKGLKHFFAKVAFIRFARASATLMDGGVPLIAAFSQSRSVMNHPLLEQAIQRIEHLVTQGEPLSTSFSGHALIPPLVPRMLGIAEQSGKLSFTMQQIAEIYEDELETTLGHFATIAQPALLILLGALVGFVLLSVLLPLTDVGSFVN